MNLKKINPGISSLSPKNQEKKYRNSHHLLKKTPLQLQKLNKVVSQDDLHLQIATSVILIYTQEPH